MRWIESNLRGERSESGIVIWNSVSIADTRSVNVNESSSPDSNRDSSGAGLTGLPATERMSSMILVWSSMRVLLPCLRRGLACFVLRHDVREQNIGQAPVTGRG